MSRDLPSGTVTFVFTDIEGSTRLLEEVGDERYGELLAEHHRVCREAWAAHGGVEVDTAGDAFFVAFSRASDALAAAAAAQAAVASMPFRVRMGVHTGEVTVNETGYVGFEVHRAARIAAAGHGGQVVVSSSTAALCGDSPQAGVLRDLGEHRFKDLAAAERVFQLGNEEFSPLKSLFRSNLPVPASSFVGRERELSEVVGLLGREDVRLVTLTGPGGTGKTRLALQAAAEASDRFPDGVWWVPLAPLRDPALVLSAVARALDLQEEPGRDLADTLAAKLGGKRQLLLLDNLEQLLPEGADAAATLRDIGGLMLVVTSRERLQLTGEHSYAVLSLDELEAVELFLQRAAAAGSSFAVTEAVLELCARLDRLPLALELAAARTVVFAPDQLLERLGQRLDLFKGTRDADPRQQTLRATIDWSYQLLGAEEQRVFSALSVFAGGCTYAAAEQVAGADPDTLQSLLDKSFLRRRDAGLAPRYWMLETLREYAGERLEESGLADDVGQRHAEWVVRLCAEAGEGLKGPEQLDWFGRLDVELPNIGVGSRWLLEHGGATDAARLATSLWVYLQARYPEEGRRMLAAALEAPGVDAPDRAWGLLAAGHLSFYQGAFSESEAFLVEAESLFRQLDDQAGLALVLGRRAWLEQERGATPESVRPLTEEGLRAAAMLEPQSWDRALALMLFGCAIAWADDDAVGVGLLEESRRIWEGLGDGQHSAEVLNNLGWIALLTGDYDKARSYCQENLAVARHSRDTFRMQLALGNLGLAEALAGNFDSLPPLMWESLNLIQERGVIRAVPEALVVVAALAAHRGDIARVGRLVGACEALYETTGATWTDPERELLETILLPARDSQPQRFDDARGQGRALPTEETIAWALEGLGLAEGPNTGVA